MISIILIEPEWPSNIGAVARVMANLDFKDLILVAPRCDPTHLDAIKRSKHAVDILKKAKIRKTIPKCDLLIATTSKLGSDYNIPRLPISPEQLVKKLNIKAIKNKKIGLVFGREGEGLHNDEIRKCDMIVTIPTSTKYAAMNLSHSVAIILYELSKISDKKKVGENLPIISAQEKKKLLQLIDSRINKMKFQTTDKKKNMKLLWRKLIGKSFLTKREAFGLFGFFRKLE
jgi:TrmH family RNA methyltransferase